MGMRKFLQIWAAIAVALLLAVGLFNYMVDPYWVFGSDRFTGFQRPRADAIDHPTLAKAYMIRRANPSTLLMGASRVEIGFNPQSREWPDRLRPVFNMGLPGSSLKRRFDYLRYALSVSKPKLVVMEVTFEESFGPSGKSAGATVADNAPPHSAEAGDAPPTNWLQEVRDYGFALWSLSALQDSVSTLLHYPGSHQSAMTGTGFSTGGDLREAADIDGYNYVFALKNAEKMRRVVAWSQHRTIDLTAVQRIVTLCREKGTPLVIVVTPGYVDELEIYQEAGVWETYRNWKRALIEIVASAARKGDDVSLWNFSGYSAYTTEAIPRAQDRHTQMKWFWETNHFKPALGDLMIGRIMGKGPAEFGTLLTPDTGEAEQAGLESARLSYENTHAEDRARLRALYAGAAHALCGGNAAGCNSMNKPLKSTRNN